MYETGPYIRVDYRLKVRGLRIPAGWSIGTDGVPRAIPPISPLAAVKH
jgi:hypothetical protein